MLSTLNAEGDYVWINKLYRRGKGIVVGDLVTVKHPWYPEVRASKRVLGMPGDFVLRNTPGEGSAMIQVSWSSSLRLLCPGLGIADLQGVAGSRRPLLAWRR